MSAVLSDKDVDTEMAADWAKISEKYTPEELEQEPVKADGETQTESDQETIPVSRKADGKFKAQAKDQAPDKGKVAKADKAAPTTDERAAPAKEEAAQASSEAAPAKDINRAPSSWRPTARAEWEKLSPTIRAEIHRREVDFQNGQSQLLPDAQFGSGLRKVIEPYRGMIEAEGGTPDRAVADLLRTAAIFRTGSLAQKQQAIAIVANQFGVDLRVFGQQQPQTANGNTNAQQGQPQVFRDPRVDQMLAHQQQQEQERVARETRDTENTVTRWMNETDPQGQPKRPYLNDVINEMSALVPQLRQADPTLTHSAALDAAYDRAIWAHPEIRTLLAQKQQTDLDAKRRTENQSRVRDARRAGSVNVPRRASTPSPGKPGSMDETISATARELGLIT